MRKYGKKSKAFTLTEALVTLIILGVIAAITIPQLLVNNPTEKSMKVMAEKMIGYLIQANTQILLFNAGLDDFTSLNLDGTRFSIEDVGIEENMSKLYQKYLVKVTSDLDYTNEYFSKEIIDYGRNSTGKVLKDSYFGFFSANDGILIGFKFYGGCTSSEPNANPPKIVQKYNVDNICGSIFFDVNGFTKPNKLGSDQYIVPIGKRGIIYEN